MWNKEKILSVISIKGFRDVRSSEGMTKSKMDTLCLSRDAACALILPPFQRPLRVNAKVKQIAEEMKRNGGVIEGIITLGILDGKKYLVDGQHRKEAFLISELEEAYADVRTCEFETMAEMAAEFVRLNSFIVRMRPDDILRGLESSNGGLQIVRQECSFIGYDQIRRNSASPIISMSVALRTWEAAINELPSVSGKGSAAVLASILTEEKALAMSKFYNIAHSAWGRDQEYWRLWGSINLCLCAWLWNNMVITQYNQKTTKFKPDEFQKGLMGLSASSRYIDWLVGRENGERDRSPCYQRIKSIMMDRLHSEVPKRIFFPSPAWVTT